MSDDATRILQHAGVVSLSELPLEGFRRHGLGYRWCPTNEVLFEARKVRRHRSEGYYSEVNIYRNGLWIVGDMNLNLGTSSSRGGQAALAKRLGEIVSDRQQWNTLLERFCRAVVVADREGPPVEELGMPLAPDEVMPRFAVPPLIGDDSVTLWHGDSETYKSMLGVYLGLCVQGNRRPVPPLSLGTQGTVLLLDWEWNLNAHNRRVWQLSNGFGWDIPPRILYRSMAGRPLDDEVERLADIVAERDVTLTIFDSIGWAIPPKSGLSGDETARLFYECVNPLPRAKLAIHHESHESAWSDNGGGEAYGSRYFRHGARLSWRIKSNGNGGIALIPKKGNEGAHFEAFGLQFVCEGIGQPARFEPMKLKDDPVLLRYASSNETWDAICQWLVANQGASAADIAEACNLPEASVRRTMGDRAKAGEVINRNPKRGRGAEAEWYFSS